jgi:hypothetical protein
MCKSCPRNHVICSLILQGIRGDPNQGAVVRSKFRFQVLAARRGEQARLVADQVPQFDARAPDVANARTVLEICDELAVPLRNLRDKTRYLGGLRRLVRCACASALFARCRCSARAGEERSSPFAIASLRFPISAVSASIRFVSGLAALMRSAIAF